MVCKLAAYCVVALSFPSQCLANPEDNGPSELANAFQAVFKQIPPVTKTFFGSTNKTYRLVHGDNPISVSVELTPTILTPLSQSRYALVVSEREVFASVASPGYVLIAYLIHKNKDWSVTQVWPEFAHFGGNGKFSDKIETKNFGGGPILLASFERFGMGARTETIAAIALGDAGPRFLGVGMGGAKFGPDRYKVCDTYQYNAEYGRPKMPNDIMSVTYSGWTAPPGRLRPKRHFSVRADVVSTGVTLALTPSLEVPKCGR